MSAQHRALYGYRMFTAAAVVPSAPLLVPPFGGADVSVAELRAAALATVAQLAAVTRSGVVVTVTEGRRQISPDVVGTFRGFGADVRVSLRAGPDLGAGIDCKSDLPVGVLVAGWLRGEAAPNLTLEARALPVDAPGSACFAEGAALRERMDSDQEPSGVLIAADGANTLTERAPGYLHPDGAVVQAELDAALRAGAVEDVARLGEGRCAETGLSGRAAFAFLAGLFSDGVTHVSTSYCAAPFGVGYYVGMWTP